jgi:hypothetical protein
MGICMECRATINGQPFCRTCLIPCEQGMEIQTETDTAFLPVNRSASDRESARSALDAKRTRTA